VLVSLLSLFFALPASAYINGFTATPSNPAPASDTVTLGVDEEGITPTYDSGWTHYDYGSGYYYDTRYTYTYSYSVSFIDVTNQSTSCDVTPLTTISVPANGSYTYATTFSLGAHSLLACERISYVFHQDYKFDQNSVYYQYYGPTYSYSYSDSYWSSSASTSITVGPTTVATTTTLSTPSPASGVDYGAGITFSASVTPNSGSTPVTSGSVLFTFSRSGYSSTATGTVNASGVATASNVVLPAGTYQIDAAFTPSDSTFGASSATAITGYVVDPATPTVSVSSDKPSATAGETVNLTATVTNPSSPGGNVPAGQIEFRRGGVTFATRTLASGTYTETLTAGGTDLPLGDSTIDAVFTSTDSNYNGGTSTSFTQHVSANTTIAITSPTLGPNGSPSTSTYNADLVVSATVASVDAGGANPTGTVTFTLTPTDPAGDPIVQTANVGSLTPGVASATFTGTTLNAGSYTLKAAFGGDATYNASSTVAADHPHTRARAATTVTLGGASAFEFGTAVEISATVSSVTAGAPPDCTACITFVRTNPDTSTTTLAAVNLTSGVASLSDSGLALGTYSYTATYAQTLNYTAQTSDPKSVTVATAISSVAVSINPAGSKTYGESFSITVAVTAAESSGIPSGDITLTAGDLTSSAITLGADGTATVSASALGGLIPAGPASITATYAGDAVHSGNTNTVNFAVNQAHPTVTFTVSPTNSAFGQAVTLNAAVAPELGGEPTGTITFFDGTTSLGVVNVSDRNATLQVSNLTVDTHYLSAQYSGDDNFVAATSEAIQHIVGRMATSTTIGSSANPVLPSTPVTLVANVTAQSPGLASKPSGTVTFYAGNSVLGTAPVASGVATYQVKSFDVGTHSVTAHYDGDTSFAPSSSPAISEVSSEAATTIAISTTPEKPFFLQSVQLKAHLSSGGGVPTGEVTFKTLARTLGTAPIDANGDAALNVPTLDADTQVIVAEYAGDGVHLGGKASIAITVLARNTTVTLSQSTAGSKPGEAVTFTATVASDVGPVPDGASVVLMDGGVALGAAVNTDKGAATFTVSSLAAGVHHLTASYGGAPGLNASTSPVLDHTVTNDPGSVTGPTTTPPGQNPSGSTGNTGSSSSSSTSGTPAAIPAGGSADEESGCSATGRSASFDSTALLLLGAVLISVRRRKR
jgi:hypothetical protein